jgi:hypothetical protein
MTSEDFEVLILSENKASIKLLIEKAKQYATKEDRLSNFKSAAGIRRTNSVDALVGMVVKHWTSISDMAKNPNNYTMSQWDEKLRDDRNYTYLLKGCLIDMGVRP